MKYIVSGGAILSLSDGSQFELAQGIHDGSAFSSEVKKHWAFKFHAKPLDESELVNEQNAEDLAASLVLLAEENNTLKAQLAVHEQTITDQGNEITSLKAQLVAVSDKSADTTDGTDSSGGEGAKNAKKQ